MYAYYLLTKKRKAKVKLCFSEMEAQCAYKLELNSTSYCENNQQKQLQLKMLFVGAMFQFTGTKAKA